MSDELKNELENINQRTLGEHKPSEIKALLEGTPGRFGVSMSELREQLQSVNPLLLDYLDGKITDAPTAAQNNSAGEKATLPNAGDSKKPSEEVNEKDKKLSEKLDSIIEKIANMDVKEIKEALKDAFNSYKGDIKDRLVDLSKFLTEITSKLSKQDDSVKKKLNEAIFGNDEEKSLKDELLSEITDAQKKQEILGKYVNPAEGEYTRKL